MPNGLTERIEKRNGKQVIVAYKEGREVSVRPHIRPAMGRLPGTARVAAVAQEVPKEVLALEAKERTRVQLIKEGKTIVGETPQGEFIIQEKVAAPKEVIRPSGAKAMVGVKAVSGDDLLVSTTRGVIPEREYTQAEVRKGETLISRMPSIVTKKIAEVSQRTQERLIRGEITPEQVFKGEPAALMVYKSKLAAQEARERGDVQLAAKRELEARKWQEIGRREPIKLAAKPAIGMAAGVFKEAIEFGKKPTAKIEQAKTAIEDMIKGVPTLPQKIREAELPAGFKGPATEFLKGTVAGFTEVGVMAGGAALFAGERVIAGDVGGIAKGGVDYLSGIGVGLTTAISKAPSIFGETIAPGLSAAEKGVRSEVLLEKVYPSVFEAEALGRLTMGTARLGGEVYGGMLGFEAAIKAPKAIFQTTKQAAKATYGTAQRAKVAFQEYKMSRALKAEGYTGPIQLGMGKDIPLFVGKGVGKRLPFMEQLKAKTQIAKLKGPSPIQEFFTAKKGGVLAKKAPVFAPEAKLPFRGKAPIELALPDLSRQTAAVVKGKARFGFDPFTLMLKTETQTLQLAKPAVSVLRPSVSFALGAGKVARVGMPQLSKFSLASSMAMVLGRKEQTKLEEGVKTKAKLRLETATKLKEGVGVLTKEVVVPMEKVLQKQETIVAMLPMMAVGTLTSMIQIPKPPTLPTYEKPTPEPVRRKGMGGFQDLLVGGRKAKRAKSLRGLKLKRKYTPTVSAVALGLKPITSKEAESLGAGALLGLRRQVVDTFKKPNTPNYKKVTSKKPKISTLTGGKVFAKKYSKFSLKSIF